MLDLVRLESVSKLYSLMLFTVGLEMFRGYKEKTQGASRGAALETCFALLTALRFEGAGVLKKRQLKCLGEVILSLNDWM